MKRIELGTRPYAEVTMVLVATATLVIAYRGLPGIAPQTLRLHPYDMWVLIAWTVLQGFRLTQSSKRWWNWHHLPVWRLRNADMARFVKTGEIVIGSGFEWLPMHTLAIREYIRRFSKLPMIQKRAQDDDRKQGTPIFHGSGRHRERLIAVPFDEFQGHLNIEGTTGSGKGVAIAALAVQTIYRNDGAVVYQDPKGDEYTLGHIIEAAHRTGRKIELFAPWFHHLSANFNPLSTCTHPEEIVARVYPLFPRSDNEFFTRTPLQFILLAARLQRALGVPWTLKGLYDDVVVDINRRLLAARYFKTCLGLPVRLESPTNPPRVSELKTAYENAGVPDDLGNRTIEWLSMNDRALMEFTFNYKTAMTGLIDSDYAHLFHQTPSLSWERIDREKSVVVILTTSWMLGDVISGNISRLLYQDASGYLGQRNTVSEDPFHKPLTMIIDEAARVVYPEIITTLSQARSVNARMIFAYQDQAGLERLTALGREGAQELLNNFNTSLVLRSVDDRSTERHSRAFGKCDLPDESSALMRGYGGEQHQGNRITQNRGWDSNANLIEPHWFRRFPSGNGLLQFGGSPYMVRMPYMGEPDYHILERLGYAEILHELRKRRLEHLAKMDKQEGVATAA